MQGPAQQGAVTLVVLHCIVPRFGDLGEAQLQPGMRDDSWYLSTVLLSGAEPAQSLPEILAAMREVPLAAGLSGSRVAYLLLLSDVDEAAAQTIAGSPELAQLPAFLQLVDGRVLAEAVLEHAVDDALDRLAANPAFSVVVDERPAVPQEAHYGLAPDGSGASGDRAAAGAGVADPRGGRTARAARTPQPRTSRGPLRRIAEWRARREAERARPPIPEGDGAEAGLLVFVTVDGPGATGGQRSAQRQVVRQLTAAFEDLEQPWWLATTSHAGEELKPPSVPRRLADGIEAPTGSRPAEEVNLTAAAQGIRSSLIQHREALARRNWEAGPTCVLFLGSSYPYMGLTPNEALAELSSEVDLCCWVTFDEQAWERPESLQVEHLLHRHAHLDVAREVEDLIVDLIPPTDLGPEAEEGPNRPQPTGAGAVTLADAGVDPVGGVGSGPDLLPAGNNSPQPPAGARRPENRSMA